MRLSACGFQTCRSWLALDWQTRARCVALILGVLPARARRPHRFCHRRAYLPRRGPQDNHNTEQFLPAMPADFKTALRRKLDHIKDQNGLTEDKAFLIWFLTEILELDDDAALEAISVEGANDKGIDFFHVDDDEGRVFIGQGKYSPKLEHAAKESGVFTLESSLNWLVNPEALRRGTPRKKVELRAEVDELKA